MVVLAALAVVCPVVEGWVVLALGEVGPAAVETVYFVNFFKLDPGKDGIVLLLEFDKGGKDLQDRRQVSLVHTLYLDLNKSCKPQSIA